MRVLTGKELQHPAGGFAVAAIAAAAGSALIHVLNSAVFQQAAVSVATTVAGSVTADTTCQTQLQQYVDLYGALPSAATATAATATTATTNTTASS